MGMARTLAKELLQIGLGETAFATAPYTSRRQEA
jgi:hypothetical protein